MSVVTLTMNPAIDIATRTDKVRATDKMRCATPRFDPGGGGINVARTVVALGEHASAIFPAGWHTGRFLTGLLRFRQLDGGATVSRTGETTMWTWTIPIHDQPPAGE
ncbi:PfkB family carbohydrate kinase [Nocardia sp. BMG51109]|uniref:PfkB family carbohydrate kinase n=1 Tax=Nocardia sp. BMG51109 TaxID=1056816 RepID=UPI0004647749|nr:PfkB family carbohydrate kinase [Nocardia sp. BMG51109]